MDTKEFFENVLPSQGNLIIAYWNPSDKEPRHQKFTDKAAMANRVIALDKSGCRVYMAVCSFNGNRRKKQFALFSKTLFLDIDVGKVRNSYKTKKEAALAIVDAVKFIGLPTPTIVDSGNGYHVYWILESDMPIDQWNLTATKLKRAVVNAGLVIDPAVPGNSAQILRPIGTHNEENEVKLVRAYKEYGLEILERKLDIYLGIPPYSDEFDLSQATPSGRFSVASDLRTNDHVPSSAKLIAERCQAIREIVERPEAAQEPAWRGMIGIVKYCIEGIDLVHEWSKGHPNYDPVETEKKYINWDTPPTTCEYFDNLGLCQGCACRPKR